MSDHIVIIGAGQGGLAAAEALRSEGYVGAITLLGDETELPYNRPPLSKAYLLGDASEAQLFIRGPEVLARKNIAMRTGCAVAAIDRAAHQVRLANGETLSYSKLIIATGARSRPLPLPGADMAGVHTLRNLHDARSIAAELAAVKRIVVIGGGFIGLEFAAVARKLGKEVTVIEAAERLMPRVLAPFLSDFFLQLHREHGAEVILGSQVAGLVGDKGKVTAVTTADGRSHAADLVLVGIGAIVNDALAAECGLECANGIVVDDCSRTSDADIFAVGDCTIRRDGANGWLRLESVQNAVEQGKSAAAAIVGKVRPFVASPWFWSDQYEVKLQMVGRTAGYDQIILRGQTTDKNFSAYYFQAGRLLAIDTVNRPQEHMLGRRLLDSGKLPTPAQVEDTGFALDTLLAQATANA
ncbi:MAG TPA: FAD-dependent oxidoreductase [Rhodocyclaceae bacterium]|nr:FAD-dependent oxidoreductase [Rhodocyclaceae bacterium]